jgi:hypothetical protein
MSLYNDGCYTAYVEYAYSGDRFLLDTIVYDEETGLPLDAETNLPVDDPEADPATFLHKELKVDKTFELKGSIIPWGTKQPLVDLDTNNIYVYTVTDELGVGGEGVSSVSFSKFKNMLTGAGYQEKDLSDEEQLPAVTSPYPFIVNSSKTINDPKAGLERFMMFIDF